MYIEKRRKIYAIRIGHNRVKELLRDLITKMEPSKCRKREEYEERGKLEDMDNFLSTLREVLS